MKKLVSILLLAPILLAACDSTSTPRTPEKTAPSQQAAPPEHQGNNENKAPSQDTQAPLVVRVKGPSQVTANSNVDLSISIERRVIDGVPMEMAIQLPEGVSMVGGLQRETITNGQLALVERTVTLAIGAVPANDLRVTVDANGSSYGVHATDFYRFGRPEPKLPQPLDQAHTLPGIKGPAIPIPKR
jgi:hypothetical protein